MANDNIPDFLKRLKSCDIMTDRFEVGIDETQILQPEGQIREGFKCGICYCIPREPVKHPYCKHLFCAPCICTAIQSKCWKNNIFINYSCSNCRHEFSENEQILINLPGFKPWAKRMWENIIIKCSCGQKLSFSDFKEHEKYFCENRLVKCPAEGCSEKMEFKRFWEHYKSCPKHLIYCTNSNGCQLPIQFDEVTTHTCIDYMKKLIDKRINTQQWKVMFSSPGEITELNSEHIHDPKGFVHISDILCLCLDRKN